MTLGERLFEYGRLLRIDRPIGTWLLLWPTLWALWLAADGVPPLDLLLIFTAGVFLMRAAGCAINDYADREIDPHVERTRSRPLAMGTIRPFEALLLFALLSLTAFGLVLLTNPLTVTLAVGGVALAGTYPFMKRLHHFPQVHLGAAFAWAVPMAYTAVQDSAPPLEAWVLFVTVLLWTTVYDTFYGMVDREHDLKIGVRSTAILFGRYDRLITAILQVATWAGLAMVGWLAGLREVYLASLTVAATLMYYQQHLIAGRRPEGCFMAFRNNHYLGLVIFGGIFVDLALQAR